VQYTTDVLFRNLWLRPDLAPRIAVCHSQRFNCFRPGRSVPYHLNRAMDNGLTQAQASEVITPPRFLRRLAQRLLGANGR